MIELPLHHAYIAPGQPEECVSEIADALAKVFADADTGVAINAAVTDTFKIEQARDLVGYSQLRSDNQSRCFVRGFETMTIAAQNTLLKALEEPATGTHFFLVTPNPSQLLETVRSRGLQIDVCSASQADDITSLADDFIAADNTADRLGVVNTITDRRQLRQFLQTLEDKTPTGQSHLREAIGFVSQWINDTGSSIDQLTEYLAITAREVE